MIKLVCLYWMNVKQTGGIVPYNLDIRQPWPCHCKRSIYTVGSPPSTWDFGGGYVWPSIYGETVEVAISDPLSMVRLWRWLCLTLYLWWEFGGGYVWPSIYGETLEVAMSDSLSMVRLWRWLFLTLYLWWDFGGGYVWPSIYGETLEEAISDHSIYGENITEGPSACMWYCMEQPGGLVSCSSCYVTPCTEHWRSFLPLHVMTICEFTV